MEPEGSLRKCLPIKSCTILDHIFDFYIMVLLRLVRANVKHIFIFPYFCPGLAGCAQLEKICNFAH